MVVRSASVVEPALVVTEVGPDTGAIDPDRRDEVLFDLGLGRSVAAFAVRTCERDLLTVLPA